ncbi:3-hydroxyacyl-CoA dehydrogenase [Alteromonas sp. H39]|uniref:3-hydroxyacyl-CoA dehydrogenase n=1 Tax=Alteromonas sp. H39 TaxID=3389876 RepID=UPI0039E19751
MADSQIKQVAVIGAGAMGRGIAQLMLQSGLSVKLFDLDSDMLDDAQKTVFSMLDKLVSKGKLSEQLANNARDALSLHSADDLHPCRDVDVVVEAIVERLEVKQKLFTSLETIVPDACILASNTSSLSVTGIASVCDKPERVAGLHFFNPVPIMKLVEVIGGQRTAPDVTDTLSKLVTSLGHVPVVVADMPGFLVNHAGRAYSTEALQLLLETVTTTQEVDRILKAHAGFKMGPFELFDLTGLDVSHAVTESVFNQYYHEPRYRPSPLAAKRVEASLLGRKTKEGFYTYPRDTNDAVVPTDVPDTLPTSVWLDASCQQWGDEFVATLHSLCNKAGISVETADTPSSDALCVCAPMGKDTTTTAVDAGLDATRTVAVDALFGLSAHRVVMISPATSPAYRDYAHALFAQGNYPVSVVNDSPGFVSQRVLAAMVNLACEIAQQGIAQPDDIDKAVTLGLGYPKGPLAWGNALEPKRILTILENLQRLTGDMRYRPSQYLRRRVALGMSLSDTGTQASQA